VTRILGLSGSLRAASLNSLALRAAARLAPAGIRVEVYAALGALPPFNADLDPAAIVAAEELRLALNAADAVLIASPEYAHGVSGVMKNALDWMVGNETFVATGRTGFTLANLGLTGRLDKVTFTAKKGEDPKVSGKANSTGATIGSVTTTDTSNAAQIKSSGSSDAKLASPQLGANCSNQKPNGSVQVNGQGAIGAVSTIGGGPNDNSYAGASIDGTTAYNATGKQAASGSQALTGNTKAVITPTSVSSSATVTSTTKTGGH